MVYDDKKKKRKKKIKVEGKNVKMLLRSVGQKPRNETQSQLKFYMGVPVKI